MKELTPEQRIAALSATAETINEILAFVHANGYDGRFHFDLQYSFHDGEDKLWPMMWGVVDGDGTAVAISAPNLYASYTDNPSDYFRDCDLTIENIRATAGRIIRNMEDFIIHYDEYATRYRAEKAATEKEDE